MPMKFKSGDKVRQVVQVITGEVIGKAIIDDEIKYLVEWKDAAGEQHSRHFGEDEIEAAATQDSEV